MRAMEFMGRRAAGGRYKRRNDVCVGIRQVEKKKTCVVCFN